MESAEISKAQIADIYVGKAWARTLTFLKLARHKTWNGALPWEFEPYKIALIDYFRLSEKRILDWSYVDNRGGDRKTANYKETLKQKQYCWTQIEYDEKCREIIKSIQERYT